MNKNYKVTYALDTAAGEKNLARECTLLRIQVPRINSKVSFFFWSSLFRYWSFLYKYNYVDHLRRIPLICFFCCSIQFFVFRIFHRIRTSNTFFNFRPINNKLILVVARFSNCFSIIIIFLFFDLDFQVFSNVSLHWRKRTSTFHFKLYNCDRIFIIVSSSK